MGGFLNIGNCGMQLSNQSTPDRMRKVFNNYNPSAYRANLPETTLNIETYDGGDEVVHPSVVFVPNGWNGYKYWMAITPFAGSNNRLENPCIYQSTDGVSWVEPPGVINPIVPPVESGYNADANIIIGQDGYMYCYWKESLSGVRIFCIRSLDGVNWIDKTTILESGGAVGNVFCPAVTYDGNQWVMFVCNNITSPTTLDRYVSQDPLGPWMFDTKCTVSNIASTREVWHVEIKYFAGIYHMLLHEGRVGSSGTYGEYYLCISKNGINFTKPVNPTVPCFSGWNTSIYKGAFVPHIFNNILSYELFYNGRNPNWLVGKTVIEPFNIANYENEIIEAIGGESPYIWGDNFDRVDGSLGSPWIIKSGLHVIRNKMAVPNVAANCISVVDTGSTDFYAEIGIHEVLNTAWLAFKVVDSSHFWRVGFDSQKFRIQKINSTITTLLSIDTATPLPTGFAGPSRIGVNCVGNTISVYLNAIQVFSVTDAFNQTITNVGMQSGDPRTKVSFVFYRDPLGS